MVEKENKDKNAKWVIKFNNISIVEVMVSNSFEEVDKAHFLKVKCL